MSGEVTVTFVDNPLAPDVFADACAGCFVHNGVLRVTLINGRVNHSTIPGPINNVVVGRIAMPTHMAEAMARTILELIENMKVGPAQVSQTKPTVQ